MTTTTVCALRLGLYCALVYVCKRRIINVIKMRGTIPDLTGFTVHFSAYSTPDQVESRSK
jgi:hypothetical protein